MRVEIDLPDEAAAIYRRLGEKRGKALEEVLSDWLWIFAAFWATNEYRWDQDARED